MGSRSKYCSSRGHWYRNGKSYYKNQRNYFSFHPPLIFSPNLGFKPYKKPVKTGKSK